MTYTLQSGERLLTATDEQAAIIDFAKANEQSLLINALAGAAKTSTLQFLWKYMEIAPTLSIAFNKRIADAMQKVAPGHVKCATVNSVGHRAWAATIGKRLQVDTKKVGNLIKESINALPRRTQADAWDSMGELIRTVSMAKLNGYVPDGLPVRGPLSRAEFFGALDEEPEGWFVDIVDSALRAGIKQAYAGLIDFDDQIYMPTIFGGSFPKFPRVMIDEAQDLSPLNHLMLEKLVTKWLCAVGDPWQSIYAFRGAMTSSMQRLRERFSMHEMTLSVTMRCPRKVVERAWRRAPHMKWPEWAIEGSVESLNEWSAAQIPDGAAIVCRNNAPLLKCALALLRAGRGVNLVGTDLGPQLMRALKKLGDPQMTQEQVYVAIDCWEAERLRKSRNEAVARDKAECLRVFAGFGPTLGAAMAYAERIFAAKGPIQLLSGHKSKGGEWDTVYHLDPHRVPSPWIKTGENLEQELNLQYVIWTRTKRDYIEVSMEGLDAEA